MKKRIVFFSGLLTLVIAIAFSYTPKKLMDPALLAERLKTPSVKKPVILNVGPSAPIPGSYGIGNAEDPANREKLKSTLKNISKNSEVVLYCGCCKLEDCWNIHEADKVLSGLGYTHYKILNLPTDFNKDWVDKKYPLQ